MKNFESIEEFYQRKFDWIPGNIRKEIGHFNVFRLKPMIGRPIPYQRRDFYKITLCLGDSKIHYADKVVEVKKQSLVFSNPHIPYKWEHTTEIEGGYFCIFDSSFFHQFGHLNQYDVFQPHGMHVFELTDDQVRIVSSYYERMLEEINSAYQHKYDLLRNLVYELLHFAMKMQPSADFDQQKTNAAQRISSLFMELLERQFPVDENHQRISLRSASEFAQQLNIHVNHLNRAIRESTQKTTSQVIAERILQEAKTLLKHSTWNVSEIGNALGFNEVTHFNNFFKKHMQMSPLKFRNA